MFPSGVGEKQPRAKMCAEMCAQLLCVCSIVNTKLLAKTAGKGDNIVLRFVMLLPSGPKNNATLRSN